MKIPVFVSRQAGKVVLTGTMSAQEKSDLVMGNRCDELAVAAREQLRDELRRGNRVD